MCKEKESIALLAPLLLEGKYITEYADSKPPEHSFPKLYLHYEIPKLWNLERTLWPRRFRKRDGMYVYFIKVNYPAHRL